MVRKLRREDVDAMSLRFHLILEAVVAGYGVIEHMQCLTEVLLLCTVLVESGYGGTTLEIFSVMRRSAFQAIRNGMRGDKWYLDARGADAFASILTFYDRLMNTVSATAFATAIERLEKLINLSIQDQIRSGIHLRKNEELNHETK
ncbi:hypothetical protein [Paraburkholderia caribensis]|nr:hypothetical protein [Paraburkholderia caribensis]